MSPRQKVIERLKRKAKKHYRASQSNQDMTCGGALADFIRGNNTERDYREFERCMARLRRIDPACPARPS